MATSIESVCIPYQESPEQEETKQTTNDSHGQNIYKNNHCTDDNPYAQECESSNYSDSRQSKFADKNGSRTASKNCGKKRRSSSRSYFSDASSESNCNEYNAMGPNVKASICSKEGNSDHDSMNMSCGKSNASIDEANGKLSAKYMKSAQWLLKEDELLQSLVQKLGSKRWQCIANELNSKVWRGEQARKGKQCRERWINHLNPQINKGPFTIEEDILMIEKQIQHGNRWAHIATFLIGRTENQVKNRFKHIQKKYVEGKYGKEFYREYSKEKVDKNTIENLDKPDKIIDELLEIKKSELNSNQEKSLSAYNTPTKVNIIKPIANYQSEFVENLPNYSKKMTYHIDNKVETSYNMYSRNVQKLHNMHPQTAYMNYSMDAIPLNIQNLNAESINLNNSMRSDNALSSSCSCSINEVNSMNGYNSNPYNMYKSLSTPYRNSAFCTQPNQMMFKNKINTVNMNQCTIPRTSIDLIPLKESESMRKQESNDDTVGNIQSEMTTSLNIRADCSKDDSVKDASMDCISDSGYIIQNHTFSKDLSISEVKKKSIRKFIDCENEENLYVMADGTLYSECIKTSKIK